ncbi:hypothetical protein HaLaN_15753 [Haematococcus lacustris]|uniref:Uncharacterized protein n=1 Tax=Haematococcus lacustris TaxID=44745 RepID=A0A699Z8A4_HAELA|nr:hypothetical protein HaLaN_15753 [Haematococcus lacustris]
MGVCGPVRKHTMAWLRRLLCRAQLRVMLAPSPAPSCANDHASMRGRCLHGPEGPVTNTEAERLAAASFVRGPSSAASASTHQSRCAHVRVACVSEGDCQRQISICQSHQACCNPNTLYMCATVLMVWL